MVRIDQETHDQFMRIAMAAKMFIKYLERLEERGKSK